MTTSFVIPGISTWRKTLAMAALPAMLASAPVLAQTSDAPAVSTDTSGSAAPAALATNEGWNARWALLFSLNNVLVINQVVGSPVTGSVGATYFLSSDTAIRGGVALGRSHNPEQVTKIVNTTGDTSVTNYEVTNPSGFTSSHSVNLRADYLKRLMQTAVAPYVGVGASLGWNWQRQSYTDDKSVVDRRLSLDNNASAFTVGARGLLGAEWRVHPSFALYADYSLEVGLYSRNRLRNSTTTESTVGGTTSTQKVTSERDVNSFLNVSTGISQGASLGLQILF